tara:strand:- start:50 stop:484 length:435 start_codon:yes stop_codon:yes gene_type:complete
MVLRKAKTSDLNFFYNLRNEATSRYYSSNKKKIFFNAHKNWYLSNFKKKKNFFFVIVYKKKNVGYLRAEYKYSFYNISICVDKNFRRNKIAYNALYNLSKKIKKKTNLKAIVGRKNITSINLFIKSGFIINKILKTSIVMIKKI